MAEKEKDKKKDKEEDKAQEKEKIKEKPKEKPREDLPTEKELIGTNKEVSIIRLVDALVEHGFKARASDIHIEPEEDKVRVRFRIDGVLHDAFIFPKQLQSEIITRIKVLSGLRTDEHQAAQDGRFKIPMDDNQFIDVRVSVAPTYYGENSVMRILAQQAQAYTLEMMGFSEKDREKIERAIKTPFGMILCTGPTGSGKTTTLYTIIRILNTAEVSIITVEDPIEYSIPGIEQIQVNSRAGLTFASGLRSILRQDPNVIMVGEIRDEETAGIAVNAALTGHLVLSTIHTNDAPTTLPRLIDMKVESFLIASTVNIAIGQRLVRKLCPDCKTKEKLTEAELKSLADLHSEKSWDQNVYYVGKGCKSCGDSGYKGRIGIYEVLEIDDELREAIVRRASASDIKKIAIKNGMTTMLEDGLHKASEGITTIQEILRVIHE